MKFIVHIFILDDFAYINGPYKAQLQSPPAPKPLRKRIKD